MSSSDSPTLFLTNHRGGGIGDFGLGLAASLATQIPRLQIEETRLDGQGGFVQARRARAFPGRLIANLGLTAWGRSRFKNYVGFAAVGHHGRSGLPTHVIVHHTIEQFDPAETGYRISSLIRWGAHQAIARVRGCNLTVFSPRLGTILRERYGAEHIRVTPLPGGEGRPVTNQRSPERARVVSAGYWAPYKGIDLFLEVARRQVSRADFFLVGRPHAGLSIDRNFQSQVLRWRKIAAEVGVATPGYLDGAGLDQILSGRSIGVLPYTSMSGASASFRLFSERGVPVVASDLPEFRYLVAEGAGIVIAPPTVEGIEAALERLLGNPRTAIDLASRQLEFSTRTSWKPFIHTLLNA